MEVLMLKTKRHLPQFDSLEGKVLLSVGIADPAISTHRDTARRIQLNGSLAGLPNGSPGIAGFSETSFPVAGKLGSMGAVRGSFSLEDTFIPIGKLPNLNGASLALGNSKGSVRLAITQAKHAYKFTVVSGTEAYASTSGSGTIAISPTQDALNLVIKLHSTTVK
jgi:hypothetical protein